MFSFLAPKVIQGTMATVAKEPRGTLQIMYRNLNDLVGIYSFNGARDPLFHIVMNNLVTLGIVTEKELNEQPFHTVYKDEGRLFVVNNTVSQIAINIGRLKEFAYKKNKKCSAYFTEDLLAGIYQNEVKYADKFTPQDLDSCALTRKIWFNN